MKWLVVCLAACSAQTDSVDPPTLFSTYCATCHGPTGQPPAALVAQIGVRDLTSLELRARVTPALVEHQVRFGSQNHLMPAFGGMLNDAQIKALAAWVASPAFVERK